MRARALVITSGFVLGSGGIPARAETVIDLRGGVGTAPVQAGDRQTAHGQVLAVEVQVGVALTRSLVVSLAVPFVLASVALPAGSYEDTARLATPRVELAVHRRGRWARAGLGMPVAGTSLLAVQALALADAVWGHRAPASFTPGMLPLALGAGLDGRRGRVTLASSVALVGLVRTTPDDADRTRTASLGTLPVRLALVSVIGASLTVQLSRRLALGCAADLAIGIAPAFATPAGRFQLGLRPQIRIGRTVTLEAILPFDGGVFGGAISLR